jgi:hypothetical protein
MIPFFKFERRNCDNVDVFSVRTYGVRMLVLPLFQSLSKFSGRLEQENFGFSRQKKICTVGTLLHHFTNLKHPY